MEVYALTGASAQRTRLHAAAARGLTRFVGRNAEIEQTRRALARAHDGRGQLVALVGEPDRPRASAPGGSDPKITLHPGRPGCR